MYSMAVLEWDMHAEIESWLKIEDILYKRWLDKYNLSLHRHSFQVITQKNDCIQINANSVLYIECVLYNKANSENLGSVAFLCKASLSMIAFTQPLVWGIEKTFMIWEFRLCTNLIWGIEA